MLSFTIYKFGDVCGFNLTNNNYIYRDKLLCVRQFFYELKQEKIKRKKLKNKKYYIKRKNYINIPYILI